MKKQNFTIVELLIVIAVIGILAGIMRPALGHVKESAKVKQALTEAKSIYMAITSFKNDYHRLPDPDKNSAKDVVFLGIGGATATEVSSSVISATTKVEENKALGDAYLNLFDVLCYVRHDAVGTAPAPATSGQEHFKLNSKKTKYLTPQKDYYGGSTVNGYRDPWGRPYIVYLDTDYNGKIEISSYFGVTGNIINDVCAVISLGSNGEKVSAADPNDLATSWN